MMIRFFYWCFSSRMNGAIPSFCTVDLLLGGKPLEEEKRPKTGDNLSLEKTGERVQNDKPGLFKKGKPFLKIWSV